MRASYDTFEHGADIGVRGCGATLEEAFASGARALFSLMVTDLAQVRPLQEVPLSCTSYDRETLFVAWLNALLAEADIRRLLFSEFSLRIDGLDVKGLARGEAFDPVRHQRGVEVKGATYTELSVCRKGDIWVAQCVVDV